MAMRKVFYGPEGILLNHILKLYDKQSLLNYARDLQIRRVSGLKKDELAEKIANELLTPTVMKRRIATFPKEERMLLERAMKSPFVPTEEEKDDAFALQEKDYAFLDKKDKLNVPVDVVSAYEKINTSEFQQYAKKMSWLAQCLYFGGNFYGVFDKNVLLEMYNARKGYRISYEELERMCNEFPKDLTECRLEEEQRFIVAEYLAYNGEYKELLDSGVITQEEFEIKKKQKQLRLKQLIFRLKAEAKKRKKERKLLKFPNL